MKKIILIFTLISLIIPGFLFIDNRYANSEDVQLIEYRLDYKILSDQYRILQQRIWYLTDRIEQIKNQEVKETLRKELRQLELDFEDMKRRLKQLELPKK